MSDYIGTVAVPSVAPTAYFPSSGLSGDTHYRTEWGFTKLHKRSVVTHTFGSANAKIEQRFFVGNPARRWTWKRTNLSLAATQALRNFWDSMLGPNTPFYYDVPQEDGTLVTGTVVQFENQPASFQELSNTATSVGLTFVEVPTTGPTASVNNVVMRFPDSTLANNLLNQVQEIIPLIHIHVNDSTYNGGNPDIYLSDRRITLTASGSSLTAMGWTSGSQTYLPRLLRIGEAGSGTLIEQSMDGSSDNVKFSFGNADRVMVQFANSTDIYWARIDLCLFRVDTWDTNNNPTSGTILQLWAGNIMNWHSDAGPEFTVTASDILSALTINSPSGTVSRTCWRRYGNSSDGCPAAFGSQAMDLVNFPDSGVTQWLKTNSGSNIPRNQWCDLGYNTPNGCMAHQVSTSYGGQFNVLDAVPFVLQPGGFFGGPDVWNTYTAIVQDSCYGDTLQEVWANDDGVVLWGLPVPCKIILGRDDSDNSSSYYSALGIVGRGPLGALTAPGMIKGSILSTQPDTYVGCLLDGQLNHGAQFNSNGTLKGGANIWDGLYQNLGPDPVPASSSTPAAAVFFCIDRVNPFPLITSPYWVTYSDGSKMEEARAASIWDMIYVAGTSWVMVRRMKSGSEGLSSPGNHSLVAMVSKGLTGYTWTAPGSRSTLTGCTNPYWVALNTFLRALGQINASSATQEPYFDVNSFVAAAGIADTVVPQLIVDASAGTEAQFRFMGVIDSRKPTRQWLQSIMGAGLGSFTWSFGRLKAIPRINASATAAFTAGNMLFGSLTLEPFRPTFEKITVQFHDRDYQFEDNTVDLTDQDHAARYNRVQNPLARTLQQAGCPTKSQASRLAIVRLREELGGVGAQQQQAARIATFKTTICALDTEAGQVCSITDTDIPGGFLDYNPSSGNIDLTVPTGYGEFRIQSWALNRDWSIDIKGTSVTQAMYQYEVGPKPSDVVPAPVPVEVPRDNGVPPVPTFAVDQSALDQTVAEIAGLSFSDSQNTHSVNGASFTLYYVNPASSPDFIAAGHSVLVTDTTLTLNSDTDLSAGEYIQAGKEIMQVGPGFVAAGSGGVVPVVRAQLGSSLDTPAAGSQVWRVNAKTVSVAFSGDFFNTDPNAASWTHDVPLPNTLLVSVTGYASNAYGPSPVTTVCTIPSTGTTYGINLAAPVPGATSDAVYNITNGSSTPTLSGIGTSASPFVLATVQQIVNVVATTQDVYLLLPPESSMKGKDVTVTLAPGSTHSVYLVDNTGDTIQGSSTNYQLSTAGTSVTVEGT